MWQLLLFGTTLVLFPDFVCGQEDPANHSEGFYRGFAPNPVHTKQVTSDVRDWNPSGNLTCCRMWIHRPQQRTLSIPTRTVTGSLCFDHMKRPHEPSAQSKPVARTCQPYRLVSESMATQLFLIVRLSWLPLGVQLDFFVCHFTSTYIYIDLYINAVCNCCLHIWIFFVWMSFCTSFKHNQHPSFLLWYGLRAHNSLLQYVWWFGCDMLSLMCCSSSCFQFPI